ncbi:MAG: hypothetical protein CBC13_00795 [Planctomycetia bacterium TMED53]|nr:MAG: hypothetical protein CBC13_00795 [Planctomycetia bacterium TMED53]
MFRKNALTNQRPARVLNHLRMILPASLVFLLLLGIGAAPQKAFAQVSGTVVDSATGAPIPGARVTLQATSIHTEAALDGSFSLPNVSGIGLKVVGANKGYFNSAVTVDTPQSSVVIALDPVAAADDPNYNFVTPFQCAVCHPVQFEQWADSRMSHTGLNTWVYDLFDGTGTPGGNGGFVYLRDSVHAGVAPDGSCASCHQPEGWIEQPFTALAPLSGPPTEAQERGVSCETCHKIADVDESQLDATGFIPGAVTVQRPDSSGLVDQVMYGLLGDVDFVVQNQMRGSFQPQLAAEACAVCHEYNNDPDHDNDFNEPSSIPAQETYSEWKNSPYGDPASPLFQTCVDCHMTPFATQPVDACSALFPPLLRDPSMVHGHDIQGTTPVFLENAVTLTLQAEQVGDELQVAAEILNDQTGHSVPSGVTLRNMILKITATDANGIELTQASGDTINALGGVGDPAQGFFAGLPGKLFAKINRDANGNESVLFTEAEAIVLDNRIEPLATDLTQINFDLVGVVSPVAVEARLIYRRAPRQLVADKGWQTDGIGLPLADIEGPDFGTLMESTNTSLEVTPPTPSLFTFRITQLISDGGSEFSATPEIVQTSSAPIPCAGFSMGIGHDPAALTATTIDISDPLVSLDNNSGPDFFETAIFNNGITIACLFDFTLQENLAFDNPVPVATINYTGSLPGSTPYLDFIDTLGQPVVQNVLATTAGSSVQPETEGPSVVVVIAEQFIRGDTNADGTIDIGDPITLLGVLFGGETAIDCDDALDANDDGLVDIADGIRILSYLFGADGPLPPPNQCGSDPTDDTLDCPSYPCP